MSPSPGTSDTATSSRRPPPWLAPVGFVADAPASSDRHPAMASPARALRRDLRTPVVALVVSWTGCVVVLWAAAVGAVLGVLVSAGALPTAGAHGLFRRAGAPGLRPWHLVDGALVGAGGAAATTAAELFGSPLWALAWLAIGLTTALAALVVLWRHEEALLRLRRARRPTMGELRRLAAVSQRAGTAMSGAEAPRLLVVESPTPRIRACLHHVVLTTALLDGVDDEELAALLCHAQHHLESGTGLRRAFTVACGWPVLALAALGAEVGGSGSADRGPLWALAWIVLWPARLLARVVEVSSERSTALEEFEADARTRRAGLGNNLIAALRELPEAEVGGAVDRAWARAPTLVALRVERLEAGRPLDGFFGGRPWAGRGNDARWWCALGGLGAAVLALTLGALSGAGVTAGTAGAAPATDTAATYTVSYLDSAFRPKGVDQVIRRSVPLSMVGALEAQAGTSPLAVVSDLAAGAPSTSRAVALGCRGLTTGRGGAGAMVAVLVRWDYDVGGVARERVMTSVVALRLMGGRWRATSVPALSPVGSQPARAAGFGPCAS